MKTIFLSVLLMTANTFAATPSLYEIPLKTLDGKQTTLKEYKGKTLLIVNTASECGYTPQYKGLQKIHEKYQSKGFVVLGFPSNDFGGQEPGTNKEIKKFCELKYKTTFPMFEKNPVTGASKQALYQHLIANSKTPGEVAWNFEKFLVDRNGRVAGRFKSSVDPENHALTDAIEMELK